jgi:ribose/xylose/arabinose/galactoside ABC-type transport system permease subunit
MIEIPATKTPPGSSPRGFSVAARHEFEQIWPVLLAVCLIYAGFLVLSPPFRSIDTLFTVLAHATVLAVLACGTTVVLISGGLDLSVGSIFAVVGVIAGQLFTTYGWPVAAVLIVALGVGTLLGMLNGIVQVLTKVPAFIVTLGALTAYRGIAELATAGVNMSRFPAEFKVIGAGYLVPISITAVATLVTWLMLTRTRIGNHAYAIGGNEEVARLAGINVAASRIFYYAFGGFMAALAGLMQTARLDFAQSTRGVGYELFAIAAVVIGGTSLFGGRGGVIRTIIGMLIIQTISTGLSYMGVDTSTQRVTIGVIIILAVYLDVLRRRVA